MSEGAPDQEFTVRVPNSTDDKSYHVMKYNNSIKVDFSNWSQVRMVRENNQKFMNLYQQEEQPKFGAGSAFGKDLKEEARRKKLGIISRKYNADNQPWLLKVGGKTGKKFKGVREGGITANTTYYVFQHGKDGVVQAYPISHFYNFTPINRYKTMDADEAEEKWAQRGKIMNKWAMMVNKKVKAGGEEGDEGDLDEEGDKKSKGGGKKDFKVSDMDDWEDDEDVFGSDSDKEKEEKSDDEDGNKKKKGKDTKKKSKKKKDGDEAFEDSDDGDDEGREVDYMSDESSDSEQEMVEEANIKGVDQDEGLSKMLDSDSSSDEENKDKKKDEDKEEDKEDKKKKEDAEEGGKKKKGKGGSKNSSRAASPTDDGADKSDKAEKRKAIVANIIDGTEPAAKKSKFDQFSSNPSQGGAVPSSSDAVTEETVIRYLKRRPMTTTDLVKKFRTKKTGINNAQLVPLLSSILKKINPDKQKTKGVTYLSIK